MLCRIYMYATAPTYVQLRKHVLHRADYTASTRQHELVIIQIRNLPALPGRFRSWAVLLYCCNGKIDDLYGLGCPWRGQTDVYITHNFVASKSRHNLPHVGQIRSDRSDRSDDTSHRSRSTSSRSSRSYPAVMRCCAASALYRSNPSNMFYSRSRRIHGSHAATWARS